MAAHYVICPYCGVRFDRDKEEFIQPSKRRYAHKKCYEEYQLNMSQEEKDRITFEEYVINLLDEEYITPRVRKQIKEYIEKYKYTYSGMLKSLKYFYEIKHNDIEKANGGIGIIPYIYKDAYNYYYQLFLAQEVNKGKDLSSYINPDIWEVTIESPRKERKIKLFDIEEELE